MGVTPEINGSDENNYFYEYYGRSNRFLAQIRAVEDSLSVLPSSSPAHFELKSKKDSLEEGFALLQSKIRNSGFPVAGVVLLSLQLQRSMSHVSDLEDLHKKQDTIMQFVKKNYFVLRNSDQLSSIVRNSFMMLEYLDYHAEIEAVWDKKEKIAHAKSLYHQEVLKLAGLWMQEFGSLLNPKVVLEEIIMAYYERGMVSMAWRIMKDNEEIAQCSDRMTPVGFNPFTTVTVTGDGTLVNPVALKDDKKLAVVIDNNCIFSKIRALEAARALEERAVWLMVVTLDEISRDVLALDRLCVKRLLFTQAQTEAPAEKETPAAVPHFLLFDESDNLILESAQWAEIDELLKSSGS